MDWQDIKVGMLVKVQTEYSNIPEVVRDEHTHTGWEHTKKASLPNPNELSLVVAHIIGIIIVVLNNGKFYTVLQGELTEVKL